MKVEPDISENYPTNINNGVDAVKLDIKAEKETNVPYQIVFLEPKIKHEPDLIIEDEGNT
jgi:hypothetical protein